MTAVSLWANRRSETSFTGTVLACVAFLFISPVWAETSANLTGQALQREASGDLNGARSLLEQSASANGETSGAEALAEFLERHGSPESRQAYLKWAQGESDPALRQQALRQVVLSDFINGKEADLAADLNLYRAAGGTNLRQPAKAAAAVPAKTISIPGPLSSFARMAALSPDLAPEELLPALARNVVTNGYEASGNEALQQTEYLRLVVRYLAQAREIQGLSVEAKKIVIPQCDSEQAGALLKALGYRMRGSCGADIVLETVNPTKAFLTVDSGFPLAQLEQDLRANRRFEFPYAPTQIPVLYGSEYWMSALGRTNQSEFIDAFLSDPSLCRLYLGLSHLDRPTAEALRKQVPAPRLKLYAGVLDFYGGMFQIQNGAAAVPGPARTWASMIGVSPSNPGAFYEKLLATDDGWAASYFDALSRISGPTAAYLTQPERLRRFYDALRGKITTPGPARPVFRSSTELMLLTTALRIDANGQPHIPGNIEVWKNLFIKHPHGKYDGKLTRSATSWKSNDDVLEALFALSRKTVENEPLRIFLTLSDVDRGRTAPISPQLAARMISSHRIFGAQYPLFADCPFLSEAAISRYLDTVSDINSIRDVLLRADTIGIFQADTELFRILSHRDGIPVASRDAVFTKLITPFGHVRAQTELFDAGKSSIDLLIASTSGSVSGGSRQKQMTELLMGPIRSSGGNGPASPTDIFLRVFDSQRLIPLDSLFALAEKKGGIDAKTMKSITDQLDRLEESEAARGSLTQDEKNSFALGYWSTRHIEQERKFNLERMLKTPEKRDMRDALLPFLRDSMVGLLYSYYTPAGAQLLLTNPQFVRAHDFVGPESSPSGWRTTEVSSGGWPVSAGGRLIGSLVSLPYAIAEAEQNFLSPKREQALIWADLVPQMIADVTINRWRDIKPEQLRWVALHVQRGKNLVAAAVLDPSVQSAVMETYKRYSTPGRVEWLWEHLQSDSFQNAIATVPTSILYSLADDPALANISPDAASRQIATLKEQNAASVAPDAISRAFGTPKPTLTHSFTPGLLKLRTFPALMGYSSRILAETWESNNLYYAALADEMATPVAALDVFVPEWNRSTIENIFATHLEDWPAILRSLQTMGNNIRHQSERASVARTSVN
ncbi:MAG: hypothetical protein ACJ746_25735 [Bryobacteraceae bacterium]